MIITNLKQGVKNPNRVNVFVDNEYILSLDVSQVVDFRLKVGAEVSAEELEIIKKASEFGKLYQKTLEWVLLRPRSVREAKDYLRRKPKEYFEFSDEIIDRLITRGHLDDQKFAEYYAENRFVKKGISKKRLKMELIKKGVSSEIIEKVLSESGRDDKEEILKIIAKKRAKYTDEKLIQYLCRQGFSYQQVQEFVLGKD